ncbi:MAG: hypothetical protein HY292_03245 [Planctomycetes bacterium]|nr:hypothetical protein [Planctomycetota bacterium]
MRFPLSTGEAAEALRTSEPRLAQAVRLGKVVPVPPIVAGRRLWGPDDLRRAALALGVELKPDAPVAPAV